MNHHDYDLGIMSSTAIGNNVVTLDLGIDRIGNPIYQIAWFNGRKWRHTYYRNSREAYATYKMILEMITD